MGVRTRYQEAKEAVREVQRQNFPPLRFNDARREVRTIVKKFDLGGGGYERYFMLWAMSALRNQEAMTRYWKIHPRGKRK